MKILVIAAVFVLVYGIIDVLQYLHHISRYALRIGSAQRALTGRDDSGRSL